MKISTKLITLVFVAFFVAAIASPSKNKNLFVTKVEKSLKGAAMEVYSSKGELVTSKKLSRTKMVIDFNDVKYGEYTIQLKKDGVVHKFNYEKRLVLSKIVR